MKLVINSVETFLHEISENETVADLKNVVANRDQLPLFEINCLFGSNILSNETVLETLGDMATVEIEIGLKGGKVHGSLARAGKVKNQTPKVEKQEKRKKPRGRAKRRMQYNRRFVNVVTTQGRKKGPNSNAK